MRQRTLLLPTLREAPSEGEAASHKLLLRAGYIRQLAAGVYTYLPLGWRVLRNVERIIREEMDKTGAQEMLLPAMQPAELWRQSGRYSVYGPELIRFHDRNDREFALGPTHEEVITALMRNEIGSYRKLPMTVYQLQTKFRDERRPRFGLLRSRELVMKDAYSFDADWEGLDETYRSMLRTYDRIFTRCGLRFRAVEAEAGAIGGEGCTHEFVALADIGEDTIAICTRCDYAANLEKVQSATNVPDLRAVTSDEGAAPSDSEATSSGPEAASPEQDVGHREVKEGDACPQCKGALKFYRGIEVGHVFKLGTKYSKVLGAKFLDASGKEQFMVMGCYGIGVSRLMAAVAEQHRDENGLVWPLSVAPFHVHLVPVSAGDPSQMAAAEEMYERLRDLGVDVLLDDREERAGVKFKDSDLIGIPVRIVIGKGAGVGYVEYKERDGEGSSRLTIGDAVERVRKRLARDNI